MTCRWCGGPLNEAGDLCVSGWSNCAGKIPFRLQLESVRDRERIDNYFDSEGALRNADGTRSIFDDVDQ